MLAVGQAAVSHVAQADQPSKVPGPPARRSNSGETAADQGDPGGPLAPGDARYNPIEGGESSPRTRAPEEDPLEGTIKIKVRGMLVINCAYGRARLVPGAFGQYLARPALQGDQFVLSGANSVLGLNMSGLSFRGWDLSASLDLSLKSPSPASRVVLAPLFYDLHIALVSSDAYVLVGQFPDVVMPFVPATANGYPGSYLPGVIGFFRPQVRGGVRLVPSDLFDLRVQTSIGRDIQTFDVSPVLVGAGAGIPDLQGRLSAAAGPETPEELRPWKRAYEVGINAHAGKRSFAMAAAGGDVSDLVERSTWSLGADVRAELPSGTTLRGRVWMGSTLGDYRGGAFESVSGTLGSISARGLWFDIQQKLTDRTTLAAGYGIDDPDDDEESDGQRTRNQAGFGNVFWRWSRWLTFAAEVSYWRTDYRAEESTRGWRGEVLTALRF